MILRSLEIEGFRCFDRPFTIGGFAPGLNIVSGPNGAGKSTLLRALRHVLLDRHNISAPLAKQQMSPWRSGLSPRIRVVIEHDGVEWRLEKRFVSNTSALLERWEDGGFQIVAEARKAEETVRSMLIAGEAPKGMAGENYLGLLQVLWTPQSAPGLPKWSPGVRNTLQQAFGAALTSPAAEKLSRLVDARYQNYFTPTGQVRSSSPVPPLEQEAERLKAEAQALRLQWESASQHRETLAALRIRIAAQDASLTEQTRALRRATALQLEVAEAQAVESRAQQEFDVLTARVSAWRDDIAAQDRCEKQRLQATERHIECERALRAAEERAKAIPGLERELAILEGMDADARAWPHLLHFRALDVRLAQLHAQIEALRAPTPEAMADIRLRHQQLQNQQSSLDAAKGSPATLLLAIALPIVFVIWLLIVFANAWEIDPWLATAVLGPVLIGLAYALYRANARISTLNREMQHLAAHWAGETLPALEGRFALAQDLQRQLDTGNAEARPFLEHRNAYQELAARRPEWLTAPPDVAQIRAARKNQKDKLDLFKAQDDRSVRAAAEAAARTQLDTLTAQTVDFSARLAQHAASVPLAALEAQHHQATTNLALARARLGELHAHPIAGLPALEQDLHTLEAGLRTDSDSAARIEGELATLERQNVYTHLSETEERLEETKATLRREARRADAIRLLRKTLATAQDNLTAALPGEIASRANQNWRHIAGTSAHDIRIDDSLTPAGLSIPNAVAGLDELSGGEIEQIAFATRLALAMQLAENTRQMAVFDDAFLATDPARASRVLELLAAAAERLQIMVLTCHPARYRDLPAAFHHNLESLKQ